VQSDQPGAGIECRRLRAHTAGGNRLTCEKWLFSNRATFAGQVSAEPSEFRYVEDRNGIAPLRPDAGF
jgi:hypothetical protein